MVWLLKRGADLTRMKNDDWRDTTLHYAAGSGSVAACEALLAWGADPAQANALGEPPRRRAARASLFGCSCQRAALPSRVSLWGSRASCQGLCAPHVTLPQPCRSCTSPLEPPLLL
jgi:hypothetical protein